MSHVKVTAMTKMAYCDLSGISPQRISPCDLDPRRRKLSMTHTPTMQEMTANTCYTLKPIRVIVGTKYP